MKSLKTSLLTLLVGFSLPLAANAQLLVGWDFWGGLNSTTSTAANLSIDPDMDGTASLAQILGSGNDWNSAGNGGSSTGTFGTNIPGADTANNGGVTAIRTVPATSVYIDFQLVNNTSNSYVLAEFAFDAWRSFGGSPSTYNLEVLAGSDITVGSIVSGAGFGTQIGVTPLFTAGATNNYPGFDIDLTGLADRTLAPGEDATFRLTIGAGTTGQLYLDNVAVAIPEPSSALLFGVAGAMILFLRRRRQAGLA